jgi:ATP/maltotriose-dependent transcriptional regulator MalT
MRDTNVDVLEPRAHPVEHGRVSEGARALPPLAEAKLAVPSVRHGVVDRPRVRRALDAGRAASLTLVAAPAGYGKTTAVRAWCANVDGALAWVTLDAGDDDPARLWRYVATAVDRARPGLGGARCAGSTWRAARSRSPSTNS